MLETPLLARQPIYDARLNVTAYELLFRTSDPDFARVHDGDVASSTVILNAFTSMPVDDILEGKPAFINFTRDLLDHTLPIDPSLLVVEVLETITINAETIAAIARLKAQGYRIALDDYLYADHHDELLPLADFVKIDVLSQTWEEVVVLVERLRSYPAVLLAEKVETREMFNACKDLGFKLFQGYFLAKPKIVKGRRLSGNQTTALQLMAALRKPDINLRDVERLISTDALLSLKVLRMVNSAMYGLNREIDSVQRATAMLGLDRIRSLAQLLIMAGLEDKPKALLASTLLRARMGQTMAEHADEGEVSPDGQFTAGLLSTLDVYLDMSLNDILKELPLSPALRDAIVHRQGAAGLLLDTAVAFDRAELDRIQWSELAGLGVPATTARDIYFESLRWVSDVMSNLN